MSEGPDSSYCQRITSRGATTFFDSKGTLEYSCRVEFDRATKFVIEEVYEEGFKVLLNKLNDAIRSDQMRCSQRKTLFDVYLKVLPPNAVAPSRQKLVGSVHGKLFKYLSQEMHLQRPLELQLTIHFDNPLNKTVVTECMQFISEPRDQLWPKAFKFELELEGNPWIVPDMQTSVNYTLTTEITARPFIIASKGLGIVPQNGNGETALMAKKLLEKRAYCDFTLVSGNGEYRVQCHKAFLDGSSQFFERMLETNMKEGNLNECKLEGSTKEGLDALLKFIYYRSVEDALGSSALPFELLHLGHMYDIPRLEVTMRNLLLAKVDDWWDLEVALELFLRTRMLEDDDRWQPLKEKVEQVLRMRSAEVTSDTNTLFDDLLVKDPKAAKELMRVVSQPDVD